MIGRTKHMLANWHQPVAPGSGKSVTSCSRYMYLHRIEQAPASELTKNASPALVSKKDSNLSQSLKTINLLP